MRQFKKPYRRRVQRLKHTTSQDDATRSARAEDIQAAHRASLEQAVGSLARARDTRLRPHSGGKRIPHHEKVFSLFEPHTEWISKGKAGVPVELGLRVAVVARNSQRLGAILRQQEAPRRREPDKKAA